MIFTWRFYTISDVLEHFRLNENPFQLVESLREFF
jgi:hypothetical protein